MSRFIEKQQKNYVPDEFDESLEKLGLGYYPDEELGEAEKSIAASMQAKQLLPVSWSGAISDYLGQLRIQAKNLMVEQGDDNGELIDVIDSIFCGLIALEPLLKNDENLRVIVESLLKDAFQAGRLTEHSNFVRMVEEPMYKATRNEALTIKQRQSGASSAKYMFKDKLLVIALNTIKKYPFVSRRNLAEKLLQYCARVGWDAPADSTVYEWVKRIDPREKGYSTKNCDYDLVLKA